MGDRSGDEARATTPVEPSRPRPDDRAGRIGAGLRERVESTIDRWIGAGDEVGIQVAVVTDGQVLVDAAVTAVDRLVHEFTTST